MANGWNGGDRRGSSMAATVIVAMVLGLASACTPAAPAAGRWSEVPLAPTADVAMSLALKEVSCSTPTSCVALGKGSARAAVLEGSVWRWVPTPRAEAEIVSCGPAGTCLALGFMRADSMMWWDGTSFTPVPNLPPSAIGEPTFPVAASCVSDTFCLVLGRNASPGNPRKTLAYRWDGTGWLDTGSVEVGGGLAEDLSCASVTSCTAVGFRSTDRGYAGYALAWDGTAWTEQVVPDVGFLALVSCPTESFCMALADHYSDEVGPRMLVARAGVWSEVPDFPTSNTMTTDALSCATPERCVATNSQRAASDPYAVLWDGRGWTEIADPARVRAEDVSCAGPEVCWVVGADDPGQHPSHLDGDPAAGRLQGRSWTVAGPIPLLVPGALTEISCVGAGGAGRERMCLGVGQDVQRWDGSAWTAVAGAATGHISPWDDVSCVSPTACVLVGRDADNRASLARWDGTAVVPVELPGPLPTFSALSDVSCAPSGDCVAVGWNSTFFDADLAFRGSLPAGAGAPVPAWEAVPGPQGRLDDLSCVTATWCAGVGVGGGGGPESVVPAAGAIIWDGTGWTRSSAVAGRGPSPYIVLPALRSVSCTAVGRCVAVGDRSTNWWIITSPPVELSVDPLVATLDGGRWTEAALPPKAAGTRPTLADVSCTAAGRCFAGGSARLDAGSVPYALVLDGGRWRPAPALTPARTATPPGVSGVSCIGTRCLTVGRSGLSDPSYRFAAVYDGG